MTAPLWNEAPFASLSDCPSTKERGAHDGAKRPHARMGGVRAGLIVAIARDPLGRLAPARRALRMGRPSEQRHDDARHLDRVGKTAEKVEQRDDVGPLQRVKHKLTVGSV